jgi:hypothetical protein
MAEVRFADEPEDKARKMSNNVVGNTWQENPEDIIVLVNRSQNNYILELPTGRVRLDAGRRMRTLRSIMKVQQVKQLIDSGSLTVEQNARN